LIVLAHRVRRDAGMDDFVTKPVTLAALTNAIERATAADSGQTGGDGADAAKQSGATQSQAERIDDLAIDRAALATLQEDLGGAAALARIVQLFLEQLDPQAEQIAQALADGDQQTLARIAHRMKSSSATLGAPILAGTLAQLELAASDGDAEACGRHVARLDTVLAEARTAFEGVMEGLEAAS
ncbi:MAG TPA: Hpt domain-containing protein, partial [Solirubrobacteraceae bacterium]|nr:Hpt domain-containing protein [Solirubrobacteraceae bacterium]